MIYKPAIVQLYTFTIRGYNGGVTLSLFAYEDRYLITFYSVQIELTESFQYEEKEQGLL